MIPTAEKLGRFGHHPNPAIDFCVEVECIEGLVFDFGVGLDRDADGLERRIRRAMGFVVGGDLHAISAKSALRECEDKFNALQNRN